MTGVGEDVPHVRTVNVAPATRPQKFSLAAAVTESARISTGDYKYTKLETEALRRFDITSTSFFVTRAHAGTFLSKSKVEGADTLPPMNIALANPGANAARTICR